MKSRGVPDDGWGARIKSIKMRLPWSRFAAVCGRAIPHVNLQLDVWPCQGPFEALPEWAMKIGFSLSNNQGIEDVQLVLGLASKAEDIGV